ncbi:MAG TPA: MBOAT family O-acyltransferase [Candidatus Kapabacteria bacterium]|nr:MBOAT family O-acyltransferase [Candidatus Kapabacteria bacterium]
MLFNSTEFAIFFPVVTALYFLAPHRFRWLLLLLASCVFYMAFIPSYILILAFTIVVDYIAGIQIERSAGTKRKWMLALSIVANVGVLGFFKYFNFIDANLAGIAARFEMHYPVHNLGLLLPIGLSFHTFQAMSYTIEVYRGKQNAERHFGIYALYVMFYPQLVAGPIERPQNLIHQFRERHYFEYQRITSGLKLMFWGLFKKIVIADRIAALVNPVYNQPTGYHGLPLIVASYLFAFQIYCDFSGYSDIAIGAAQVMGFRLMQNFNAPYFAKSIAEFWKRWHISLSTWFRDYLYIPLGGNRVPVPRWYFNLFFVFLVSGLWHGANWTFVIWGALHGSYMVASNLTKGLRARITSLVGLDRFPRIHNALRMLVTFHLVVFGWVFFRAHSLHDAMYIITHSFQGIGSSIANFSTIFNSEELAVAIVSILFLELIHAMQRRRQVRLWLSTKPWYYRWALYYAMATALILFAKSDAQPFIYFQF